MRLKLPRVGTAMLAGIAVALVLVLGWVVLSPKIMSRFSDPGDGIPHSFIPGPGERSDEIECPLEKLEDFQSIWHRPISACRLKQGWSRPQPWGAQVFGSSATVGITLNSTEPSILSIKARKYHGIPSDRDQQMTVVFNDRRLGRHELAGRWKTFHFDLTSDAVAVGENTLRFEFSTTAPPVGQEERDDTLRIAGGIKMITVRPSNRHESPPLWDRPPTNIWDADRQALVVDRAGTVVLPVAIPDDSARLRIDLKTASIEARTPLSTDITLDGLDGDTAFRATLEIPGGAAPMTAEIPVGSLAGGSAVATVTAELDSGRLEISKLRFVPKPADAAAGPSDDTPSTPIPDAPPDIVLITLDAARADHFSFMGYDRPTTPRIDELAGQSLVFPAAYALVPYTLCSVPTMITGLSFLDHRVVDHPDVLHDNATTLAESLKAAGYRTAAFSATPNNSISKGFDQGYDEFVEVWTLDKRHAAMRADFMADQVTRWLDATADDPAPMHLQVHMVPPHAPYLPPKAFDRFSDSGYEGPCDGRDRTLVSIETGHIDATPECLEHLLDLYDGNLRAADDATGRILDALRERPRWDNTIVLVVSDHGEAFMEHGKMQHNSTVFSEMLHVPFVLRLPPRFDTTSVDTGRLVTLADIVPTFLGTAGLEKPEVSEGVDLLDPTAVGVNRWFVTRDTGKPVTSGIRTLRWSLIVDAAGSGALFDLESDPGELTSVHVEKAPIYRGLGTILAERFAAEPRLSRSDASADITEEDRAMLEALGYLRE